MASDTLLPAISSFSLSQHASHLLSTKLEAAAAAGFKGVEIFHADLVIFAAHLESGVRYAAAHTRSICNALGLTVIALSSFDNFEGMPTPLASRLETAREWVELARALGTTVVQVPSTYAVEAREASARGDTYEDLLVDDLVALVDAGVGNEDDYQADVTFAYEWMPWSLVSTWQDAVRIVREVRSRSQIANFGLCCDTFHLVAGLWADCRREDGRQEGGDEALRKSLKEFRDDVKADEIVYLQLSDAEKTTPPVSEQHPAWQSEKVDGKLRGKHQSNMLCSWGRLFPFEEDKGAYFPLRDVCAVWLVEMGYKGWVSMEIFNRELKKEATLPKDMAERGMRSWQEVLRVVQD